VALTSRAWLVYSRVQFLSMCVHTSISYAVPSKENENCLLTLDLAIVS